jgi:hypothetical protein
MHNTLKPTKNSSAISGAMLILLVAMFGSCSGMKKKSSNTDCATDKTSEDCKAESQVTEVGGSEATIDIKNSKADFLIKASFGDLMGLSILVAKNTFDGPVALNLSQSAKSSALLLDLPNIKTPDAQFALASLIQIRISGSQTLKKPLLITLPDNMVESLTSENYKLYQIRVKNNRDSSETVFAINAESTDGASGAATKFSFSLPYWATFSVELIPVAPTVSISSTVTSPTSTSPIPVTFAFSESVTGFIASDVTLTNATITDFAGSGDTYTSNIMPIAQGSVTVSVSAGKAKDSTNTDNSASNTLEWFFDGPPTVTITSSVTAASTTSNSTIPVTFTFSESVTGFIATDVTLMSATITDFAGSGAVYTATIVPTAPGSVSVSVPAARAQDATGNHNSAANTMSWTFDPIPTVTITSTVTDSSTTSTSLIPVTFTFSESVTGFIATDVNLTNATITGFAGSGASYTANIVPTAQGSLSVSVPAARTQDAIGNNNSASNTMTWTFDAIPTVTITSTVANFATTSTSPIPVTITFSESVTGFIATDVGFTNAGITGFAGSGATYTANILPSGQGPVSIQVPATRAKDATNNDNSASNTLTWTFDRIPTVTITSTITASSTTPTSPIPVSFTFSESMTGFTSSDVSLTNATMTGFSGSGATYTANIVPTAEGSVSAMIAGSTAQDATGNNNLASNMISWTFDNAPTVTINSPVPSPRSVSWELPIPLTINFSESVTGFTLSDITTSQGSISDFSGSGATYTATITPSSSGLVRISILSSVAHDAVGNGNLPASRTLVHDASPSRWTGMPDPSLPRKASDSLVWTGTRAIIWGGIDSQSVARNTGEIYNPSTMTWTAMSTTGAPSGRYDHSAIWTGSKMIVWGGRSATLSPLGSGGIYDPASNTWTSMSESGAPTARVQHYAVWTGSKVIIYGGLNSSGQMLNSGAAYDPTIDTWTAIAAGGYFHPHNSPKPIWTGSKLITFDVSEASAYDPILNTWETLSSTGAPLNPSSSVAWVNDKLTVWGGADPVTGYPVKTGSAYNSQNASGTWSDIAEPMDLEARANHWAVSTGTKMIVWGGNHYNGEYTYWNSTGIYDPAGDTWTSNSSQGAPKGREGGKVLWTGSKVMVYGGSPGNEGALLSFADRDTDGDGVFDLNDCNDFNASVTTSCPDADGDGYSGDNDANDGNHWCVSNCRDYDQDGYYGDLDPNDDDSSIPTPGVVGPGNSDGDDYGGWRDSDDSNPCLPDANSNACLLGGDSGGGDSGGGDSGGGDSGGGDSGGGDSGGGDSGGGDSGGGE